MALNSLRMKRKQKYKLDSRDTGVTLSDYSLVRRIHSLYQKMIKTFPMEISCYLNYIEWAASVNSTKVLSRTLAQAIQFHPNLAIFWVLAAKWEWDHNQSVSAARILLQRGIRINPHQHELWIEYFKLEVAWILKLQARRSVLFGNKFVATDATTTDDPTDKMADDPNDPSSSSLDTSINLEELEQERDETTRKLLQDSITNQQNSVLYDYAIPKAIYKASKTSIQGHESLDLMLAFLQILGHAGPQASEFCKIIYGDVENWALDCLESSPNNDTNKMEAYDRAAKAFHVLCQRNLQPFCVLAADQGDGDKEGIKDLKKPVSDPSFPLALDAVCQEYEDRITLLITNSSPHVALLLLNHYLDLLQTIFPLVQEEHLLQYIVLKADACFLKVEESSIPTVAFYCKWLETVPSIAESLEQRQKVAGTTTRSSSEQEEASNVIVSSRALILERGLARFPQNGALWLAKWNLDKDDLNGGNGSSLADIVEKVGADEDGLLVWRAYLDELVASSTADQFDEINTQFEKAIALFSKSKTSPLQPLLSHYLHHLFLKQKNSEKAYTLVSSYLSKGLQTSLTTVIKTFVELYVELYKSELACTPDSSLHLRRIEKMWTLLHDVLPKDLDLWVAHISFELSVHSTTGAFIAQGGKGASQVYWKALKVVEPVHHPSLEQKYQTLLNA